MSTSMDQSEIHLRDYVYILKKRRALIVLFFSIALTLSILSTLTTKVLYEAQATILIEKENPNVVDFKEVMAFDSSSTDYYQTQYQILKSRSLIEALVEKEKLEGDAYITELRSSRIRSLLKSQVWLSRLFGEFMSDDSIATLFIKDMLRIKPVRNSKLVDITVLHPDAVRASELANGLANLYIDRTLKERFAIANRATHLIADQVASLKEQVVKAERKLQAYKEENKLVNIPSMHEQDRFLQDAKLELMKLQAEESKLSARYLPLHPKFIHIKSQREALERKILEEEKKILSFSRMAVDYGELEREAESARQIYESLLKRLQETNSEAQTQASNITIVDSAKPPEKPSQPKPILNLLIGIFLGATGGLLLAFFIEYLDSTVRIPEDIEKALGLDLIGIIPQADRISKGPAKGELYFLQGKPSAASEAFRALRTALLFRLRHVPGCRIILMTSPNPSEGKTTASLNLAYAFQQNHLKVLLVDGDLRKPRLHKLFDLVQERGLTDVLDGDAVLEEVIHRNVKDLGMDFLSCGKMSQHPTELIGSDKMREVMEKLKTIYDLILVDTPPYLAVADVSVLSDFGDAIVVVARHHQTDRRHLKHLRKRFHQDKTRVLGVVINRVGAKEKDYYYQQYYYYGYGNAGPKK